MKVEKYPSVYYSRDGEYSATLYATTLVSLISQLKAIQHNEPCDTTCMRVHVVMPWRTGDIRLWQIGSGNVDMCEWYIDVDDFYDLAGVKYIDAEAAYHDTVVR